MIEFIIIQWYLIGDLINGKFCEWALMKNILENIAFFQCSTTHYGRNWQILYKIYEAYLYKSIMTQDTNKTLFYGKWLKIVFF